ncbi:hypothetical protein F5X99DRAFT_408930 [Biscogniauxia marginata]|nr:hypothetical protein F5X99DRAFT_408930 [Biscogniauxia marginata]
MPNGQEGQGQGQGKAMTSSDASRVQSGQVKAGHDMFSAGFAARAQSAAAKNENTSGSRGGQQNSKGSGKK